MASYSSISKMHKCKKAYVLGRKLFKFMPKSDALTFGSAYHQCIEDGDLSAGIKMLEEAGLESKIDLLKEMVDRLFAAMDLHKIEVLEYEHEFHLEVDGTDETLHGFIDGVAIRDGKKILVENKTSAALDITTLRIDAQITSYLYAARELGLTDGTEMVYIVNLKKKDKPPRVLANGCLSTAKNQGCTPDAYLKEIINRYDTFEQAPEKVQICHDNLVINHVPLIAIIRATRTTAELDAFGAMIRPQVVIEGVIKKQIKDNGYISVFNEAFAMPSKFSCAMCDVKSACVELSCNIGEYNDNDLDQGFVDSLSE